MPAWNFLFTDSRLFDSSRITSTELKFHIFTAWIFNEGKKKNIAIIDFSFTLATLGLLAYNGCVIETPGILHINQ